MSGVDNMNYMYSLNATGNSNTTLIVNFDVKTDPNTDLILTQARETQAARNSRRCQQLRNYRPKICNRSAHVAGPVLAAWTYVPIPARCVIDPMMTHSRQKIASYVPCGEYRASNMSGAVTDFRTVIP